MSAEGWSYEGSKLVCPSQGTHEPADRELQGRVTLPSHHSCPCMQIAGQLAVEHRIYIDRESTLGLADEGARALQDCLKCSQEWERQTWHTRVQLVGRC